ncbi:MAG: cobalamin biosynthesis protein [Rhodobacter sp.]|nr:cobalamin biosynthesis protein [Rhodobacter sp.]MCA3511837.1 cobalamin biosynthesis protein [Rhodobacter sp.]MCA3520118.1 cobalamin biosynthesis protein [Rhodobacter sp.]MCA3522929.1 cobalamin biosynthesis protein [Rhodobacter sp.]MCA3524958.1 cobalamin biosynthesis protein [Rhodobacter sp.]
MIVAGFGFRQAATVESLLDALDKARGTQMPSRLATAEDKAQAPVFQALAARLGLPGDAIAPEALAVTETPTRSARVRALHGSGSLAEAAALVAAGPGASLLGPRAISDDRMAACALATRTVP